MADERLGFPTQKPTKLLERIIGSTCDKGDWVLDPFCGCGTAIVAAEKLGMRWIGIDITYLAINLVKGRLRDSFPHCQFIVEGDPRDLGAANELARNRYQFQCWALSLVNARPYGSSTAKPTEVKKGADEGVDGWMRFPDGPEGHFEKVVVQVKSGHVGVKDIRELRDVVNRQQGAIGILLTLEEPTSEMIKEVKATDPYVSRRWNHEYPRIQILTIEQLLRGKRPDMPPTINLFQEAPKVEKILRIPKQEKLSKYHK
jgi:site-specific DNA-methyltransferase (adenine-specific)